MAHCLKPEEEPDEENILLVADSTEIGPSRASLGMVFAGENWAIRRVHWGGQTVATYRSSDCMHERDSECRLLCNVTIHM